MLVKHCEVTLHGSVMFSEEITAGILVDRAGGELGELSHHTGTIHPLLSPTVIFDHPVPGH